VTQTISASPNYVFRGLQPTASELIANNCLNAGFVAAAETSPSESTASGEMTILIDGKIVDRCQGRPLQDTVTSSLRWLANTLPKHDNTLKAGDVILIGSCCRLIPIDQPCHIVVDSPHGRVEAEVVRS
jgi:2-keto-4-pentenoate hydratase